MIEYQPMKWLTLRMLMSSGYKEEILLIHIIYLKSFIDPMVFPLPVIEVAVSAAFLNKVRELR